MRLHFRHCRGGAGLWYWATMGICGAWLVAVVVVAVVLCGVQCQSRHLRGGLGISDLSTGYRVDARMRQPVLVGI